jgi:hypothetical protein
MLTMGNSIRFPPYLLAQIDLVACYDHVDRAAAAYRLVAVGLRSAGLPATRPLATLGEAAVPHRALVLGWAAFCQAIRAGQGMTAHCLVSRLYGSAPPTGDWGELRAALEHFVRPAPGQPPDHRALGVYLSRYLAGTPVQVDAAPAPLRRIVGATGRSGGRRRWLVEVVAVGVGR